jgi:hypothetical protein
MSKAIFDELVIRCTTELFQARGIALRKGGELDGAIEYAATLGFAGDKVRGMLGLGMDPLTLRQLVAKDIDAGADHNAEDWLGESVNQLLGRLKNKLMGYNVVVSLALPTVLRGVHLRFLSSRPAALWTYSFESDVGAISVWLDVRHDSDFVLTPTRDPDMHAMPEGDLVLF